MDKQSVSFISPQKINEKINFQSRLLEAIKDSIIVSGLDGKINYWNKGSERLFGWLAEEIMGLPFSIIMEEASVKELPEQITEIQAGFWEGTITIRTKAKENKFVKVSVTAMNDQNNNPAYLVGVFSDITELVESKIKTEEALRNKGDFLSNVSHEIRTPITSILGNIQLLSTLSIDDEQKYYLQSIKENTDQLLGLINDLLDISKIEANKLLMDESTFNLRKIIYPVIKIFEPCIEQKQLDLTVDIAADLPEEIISDMLKIKQVLSNLLSNAIKFTEHGGIMIKVSKDGSTENTFNLIFEIVDTGIGIDHNKLTAIFEPFTQADSFTSRKYGGTGLGLTICKKIIEMLKGMIQVESIVGQGSKFLFSIPVRTPIRTINNQLNLKGNFHLVQPKLLLISANEKIFTELTKYLSDFAVQVLWLSNKERLSSIITFYEPEAVVIDFNSIALDFFPDTTRLYFIGNQESCPQNIPASCKYISSFEVLTNELKH